MRSIGCARRCLIVGSFIAGLGHSLVADARTVHPFPEAAGLTQRCKGCSCKCGPGFRLPTNDCASWDQHWKFMKKGYPEGTVDEVDLSTTDRNPICPPEVIKEKRSPRQ